MRLTDERLEQAPALRGGMLENFAGMELRKHPAWSKEHPRLFHWRTHGRQEVDLVLEAGGRRVGIEVKAGTSVTMNDFKGLKALFRFFIVL
jgi:hypothetical protein